jgi:hypothetical protein
MDLFKNVLKFIAKKIQKKVMKVEIAKEKILKVLKLTIIVVLMRRILLLRVYQ